MARIAAAESRIPGQQTSLTVGSTPSQPSAGGNFMALLAASPAATQAYLAFEQRLADGQLTPAQRELLALTVAEINGSKYCLSAHYLSGKKAGLSDEDIKYARRAAARDPKSDALLRFVQEVTLQRGDISDADFLSLQKAGFKDGQIVEIVANIALNVFTNYFNILAKTELEKVVAAPVL